MPGWVKETLIVLAMLAVVGGLIAAGVSWMLDERAARPVYERVCEEGWRIEHVRDVGFRGERTVCVSPDGRRQRDPELVTIGTLGPDR